MTSVNVAFGYLAVLLAYLARYEPIRERFASLHSGNNLEPLTGSVREFITFYKTTDTAAASGDETTSTTGQLQSLVDHLENAM